MGYHRCKGNCTKIKGYRKGHRYFMKEGKRWCPVCDYKIDTNNLRCTCCGSIYRIKARKTYPYSLYQHQLPLIAQRTVVNRVNNCHKKY